MTASTPKHKGARERLAEPGSAQHLALVRIAMGLHLGLLLTSPALPLLTRIGGHPHPMTGTIVPAALEPLIADLAVPASHLGVIAAGLLVVGLGTRVASAVLLTCFFVTQHYWFRSTLFHDDWLYFTFFLLVLVFAPSGDAWSADAWLARRRGRVRARDPLQYRWPVEAMIFWFALVYVAAGLSKVFPLRKGVLWLTGRSAQQFAVEFVRDSPVYWLRGEALFDYGVLWPFTIASVLTVVVELGAILLVLTHRWRWAVVASIIGLHVSIFMLGIPGFVGIALVCVTLFLPPERFPDRAAALQATGSTV